MLYEVVVTPGSRSLKATTVAGIKTKATLAASRLQFGNIELLPINQVEQNMTISVKNAVNNATLSDFKLAIFNHNNESIVSLSVSSSSSTHRLPVGNYRVSVSKTGYQNAPAKSCSVLNRSENNCPISLVPDGQTGPVPGTVFRDTLKGGGQGPEMVILPTGSFSMGSPATETGRDSDEGPVRTVTISKRIAIGKYEVTFADYDRFADATAGVDRPIDEGWGRGTRPVINVSQTDAKAYADWLSAQTGKSYRLPTEAEWEYAARAGTSTRYSWGDSITCSQASYGRWGGGPCNLSRDTNLARTMGVGSFASNPFGLYDLHGNVWEWVEDCYVNTYTGAPSDGSARTSGCGSTTRAVVRGGSWGYLPSGLRSAVRTWFKPSTRINYLGFRLVQDINP